MTITEFLLARIAEDEAAADRVEFRPYLGEGLPQLLTERVLAECEGKRRIVELHGVYPYPQVMVYGTIRPCEQCGSVDDSPVEWPCPTLLALASVYADHTGFDPAWRVAD